MHKDAAQNRAPHPRCTVMKRMIAMGHRCPQASGWEVHAVARTATAMMPPEAASGEELFLLLLGEPSVLVISTAGCSSTTSRAHMSVDENS